MTDPKKKLLAGVAVLATTSLVLFKIGAEGSKVNFPAPVEILADPANEPRSTPETGSVEAPPQKVASEPSGPMLTEKEQQPPEPAVLIDRVPILPAAFSGVLVGEEGESVIGARLSWTTYPDRLVELSSELGLFHWMIDAVEFEQTTVWADSDANGIFIFAEPPASVDQLASVIWATHLDYLATSILLDRDPESALREQAVIMQPSTPIRVLVLDPEGEPAGGASVSEYAGLPPLKAIQIPLAPEEMTRLYLRRSFQAGPRGEVMVPDFSGELVLEAKAEARVSEQWAGQALPRVELILTASFSAKGELGLPSGIELFPQELSVTINAWTGSLSQRILQVPINQETMTWGPVHIPLGDEDRFSFDMRGMQVQPRTAFLPAPVPGEEVTVDFDSEGGSAIWFALAGEDNKYLDEGLIELSWDPSLGYGTQRGKLRADGYAYFPACPEGTIKSVRASSPGFVSKTAPGYEIPEPEPVVHLIHLVRGGGVSGQCLADGVPVEDFEILVWPTEDIYAVSRHRFRGAEDGRFVLEGAPIGEVQILALSKPHAPSDPQLIHVAAGEYAEVELPLQAPRTLSGVVLDETGSPLSSASVQLFAEDDREVLTELGAPIPVDTAGRFGLEGLAPGRAAFVISAPGYSSTEKWAQIPTTGETTKQTIRLTALRGLELRLHFAQDVDPRAYSVTVGTGPTNQEPPQNLSASGTARFDAINTATDTAWLRTPDGEQVIIGLPRPSGHDWVVEYTLGGTGRILIDVDRGSLPNSIPAFLVVRMDSYTHGEEPIARMRHLPEGGEAVFEGVRPGNYIAQVSGGGLQAYGTALISVAEGQTSRATVHLGTSESVFRIVDQRGDPLAGVALALYDSAYPLWRRGISDANGICTISGAPAMPAFAGLQHANLGDLWGLPVELGQGSDEIIELEFIADSQISLRLMDGETPISNVAGRLNASENGNVIVSFGRESGGDGRMTFEPLGEALYGIDLRGSGIWGKNINVKATASDETTVQIRRTGSLLFQLTCPPGLSASGIPIELVSVEFEESAASWISQDRLRAVPGSAKTDGAGTLLFPAIPHGTYRWRLLGPNGKEFSGMAEVPIAAESLVGLVIE